MKRFLTVAVLFFTCLSANAESKSFNLGKWTEIYTSVLKELNRSYVDSLPVDRMNRAGINALLSELDPYTIYVPEEENDTFEMMINNTYGGIGAIIYKPEKDGFVMINEPYADSPAARSGLRCGDEIMEIDGVTTVGLETKACSDRMKGKPGTVVRFKVKKVRSGEIVDIDIKREKIHIPNVEYSGMLNDTTGYIVLAGFTEGDAAEIRSEIVDLRDRCGMKRLVLDLRGNGGGLLSEAVELVSAFVPEGSLVVSAKGRNAQDNREYRTERKPVDLEMPVAVLVNSTSASASEIVSGALQDMDRGVIMGQRTFGKGLVQGIRPLPYKGQLKVTTAKYYTPSGRCVQAIDYSHRNEDGSVGHIPDSLTSEFRTSGGRTVRDGGGITPDIVLKANKYSRLTYSVVLNGIVEQYVLKYVSEHESIPTIDDFHFTDYEDFVAFASEKEFDSRSSAKTYFDKMKEEMSRDGLSSSVGKELDALEKTLEMDKATFLRMKKDEIVPFIEEELAVRYYFQKAAVRIRIRYDRELKEALEKFR